VSISPRVLRLAVILQANPSGLIRRHSEESGWELRPKWTADSPRLRLLSRVTNDIDNISQTLSQIVTSLLTIVGVLVMMLLISPLLAVIALVTVPVSIFVATRIGKAAQPHFLKQWSATGRLNGHIEERGLWPWCF
jgi:ATP-binding cassette subfamily B multidrug efflux pump